MVGTVFEIGMGTSTMGRANGLAVCLLDDGVSRRHARIIRDQDGSAKLVDLDSTNGTYINGRRIHAEGLREGDRVRIGQSATLDFRYSYRDSQVADLPPAREADSPQPRARKSSDQMSGGYENLAATLDKLGRVYTKQGDHDAAIEAYRRTLRIREAKFGREHPAVAAILDSLGEAYQTSGAYSSALDCHRRALMIYETKSNGRPPREAGHVLAHIGRCELHLQEPRHALDSFERSLELLRAHGASSAELARVRFGIAQTLHRLSRDTERTIDLAKLARDAFAAGGSTTRARYDEVQAWLGERGHR